MKIIFLDIDGVLVKRKQYIEKIRRPNGFPEFDPVCVENLKYIINNTGAKLVISSTWRSNNIDIMKEWFFNDCGLGEYIIGVTPNLDAIRGDEIKQYIKNVKVDNNLSIDKFIIIDDDSDMGSLLPYLVQTNFVDGLTKKIAEIAILKLE